MLSCVRLRRVLSRFALLSRRQLAFRGPRQQVQHITFSPEILRNAQTSMFRPPFRPFEFPVLRSSQLNDSVSSHKKTSVCQCVKQRCYCVFASWTPFLCLELDTAQNTLCFVPAKILSRTAIT